MAQIIKITLAVIFGLAAFAKFSGKSKEGFLKSGYGLPFMYVTAVAEVLLAIGLFTRYDVWAAIGLITIMIGAIATLIREHVALKKYGMAVLTLALLSVLLIVIA